MSVRAIFYVQEMTVKPNTSEDAEAGDIGEVTLTAAAKGPYKRWSKWTPFGQLKLGTLNPAAFAWFRERLGSDVTLTFDDPTPADLIDD